MEINIVYFLIATPIVLGAIIWLVLYSCRQHQKNFVQTSIRSQEARTGRQAG
jgi:hypothetical protein